MAGASNSSNPNDRPLRLLQSVPNKVYQRLIVRYPGETDREFAFFYHEAALRLASTYAGRPIDDTILMPFLMLYRHAFELRLKNLIRYLARIRRRYHDLNNSDLDKAAIDEKLQKGLGHNLAKLQNELLDHYSFLDLSDEFPASVSRVILMLHDADKRGTAFRYSGQLPNIQENADFPALAELLDNEFTMLGAVQDWIDSIYSAVPEP